MGKAKTTALVPAASRAPETLSDVEAVLNGEAIDTFVRQVGGRAQLADTLAVAGRGSEIDKVTTFLLDPRYQHWSLRRICASVGLTVADLFAAYKKALLTRAQIEATAIVARRIPPIVTDVMDRALTDPTVERHKLALDLGQLLEKKGGLIVQQTNMAATLGATAPGALEQLQQAVGDLLFGDRRPAPPPVEGEEIRDDRPAELPDDAPEEDPELPFGDPRAPAHPRPPDAPGESEPS